MRPTGSPAWVGQRLLALTGNPLLAHYRDSTAEPGTSATDRDTLLRRYSFAIPTDEALAAIMEVSPGGVVELGAGTGYWARLLHERGVDVIAHDRFPPPAPENPWFAGSTPWYPVTRGGEEIVEAYTDRTLLLVWPTRNEEWAARAATAHHAGGGRRLVYVGEGPGGHTGDDQLHALLGLVERCLACAYGLTDVACTCHVEQRWQLDAVVTLPHWEGFCDDLHVYRRLDAPKPVVARRRRSR